MERNVKSIVVRASASGVDLSDGVGLAVGIDSSGNLTLGGNYGVVTEAYQDGASVALFGGNTGLVEVKLAGTVKDGDPLVRNPSTGKWTKAGAANVAEAIAAEDGVADEKIPAVLLAPAASIGTSVYAAADHDHDAAYAAIDHDHDEAYSALNHNHDGVYEPAT